MKVISSKINTTDEIDHCKEMYDTEDYNSNENSLIGRFTGSVRVNKTPARLIEDIEGPLVDNVTRCHPSNCSSGHRNRRRLHQCPALIHMKFNGLNLPKRNINICYEDFQGSP
jgi:hypothetical protein